MDRQDYVAILDRALVSAHGVRLDFYDDATARRVRAKIYHVRSELRAEARSEPATTPAITYDPNGKLLGVIDILRRRKPAPTPYDALRLRVWQGSLYIVRVAHVPRRVDELDPTEAEELHAEDLASLPHWPPWIAY
jgi:hypothetical protein